jgi:hypothetical protein
MRLFLVFIKEETYHIQQSQQEPPKKCKVVISNAVCYDRVPVSKAKFDASLIGGREEEGVSAASSLPTRCRSDRLQWPSKQ